METGHHILCKEIEVSSSFRSQGPKQRKSANRDRAEMADKWALKRRMKNALGSLVPTVPNT